ncbi:glycoside hydrolase family protein [Chryseolinea sp. Jin1]|uniref:Glycoside hydrolase family protein n=2 Tax=Chryseolinea lacunae TaxID=2801331 RepID=A0ABS1L266_9BACT|nr:glycoside hydrolase family protein [Chryseolinea lacunae]
MIRFLVACILTLIVIVASAQKIKTDRDGSLTSMNDVDLFSMIQPIPATNVFADSAYNIWCGSVLKGYNGKYYMFYSRWPRSLGHYAWISHSEIALAKADNPGGPYRHVKVIFNSRGSKYWDGAATHNPTAILHNGKYYLYYVATTGDGLLKQPTTMKDSHWWHYRNTQRIGVAVCDDPEKEWQRFDEPVLNVSRDSTAFDALMVSNPAVTVDDDGKVILIYKQVGRNGTLHGGNVRFGVAFAKQMLGPFEKHPNPIFEASGIDRKDTWMVAEDPYLWTYKKKHYAIVRDVAGHFTHGEATWAMLTSLDGVTWQPAKHPKAAPFHLKFSDGSLSEEAPERPCLLREKGVPIVLFGALGIKKREHSYNVAMPLKAN